MNRGHSSQKLAAFLALVGTAGLFAAGCATSGSPATTTATPAKAKPAPAPAQAIASAPFDPFDIDAQVEQQSRRINPVNMPMAASRMNAGPNANPTLNAAGDPVFPVENASSAIIDGMEGLNQLTFAQEGSDFDPKVSRDGKWLVFASTQHRATPDIYIKPVGSRTVTQLTADPASEVMPAISPDGSRIAFCSNRNGWWNMYVMSTAGGQAMQLSTQFAHELHPSWSPDGSKLVFCRLGQVSGRWELWVMDVSQPQTCEFIGYGMFPEWNPVANSGFDGSEKILFQRGRERGDRAFSLWTIDYKPGSAGSPTEIVSSKGYACINGSWNGDGKWIVYSSVPAQLSTPGRPLSADLNIVAADGSGRANLTGGKFTNVMATWGGDGRIYFVSDRAGLDNVWSVSTDRALAAAGKASASPMTNAAKKAPLPIEDPAAINTAEAETDQPPGQ